MWGKYRETLIQVPFKLQSNMSSIWLQMSDSMMWLAGKAWRALHGKGMAFSTSTTVLSSICWDGAVEGLQPSVLKYDCNPTSTGITGSSSGTSVMITPTSLRWCPCSQIPLERAEWCFAVDFCACSAPCYLSMPLTILMRYTLFKQKQFKKLLKKCYFYSKKNNWF